MSREILKKANGLRAFCIFEILLAFIGGLFLHFMFFVFVPIDVIGIIAVRRMNTTLLTLFSFLKVLCLAIFSFLFADLVTRSNHVFYDEPAFVILMVTVLIYQGLGVFFSVKLRREILLAQHGAASTLELNTISDAQMPPMSHMSHVPPMSHFHSDPHATAGVPGYPYPPMGHQPPHFFPAMYMNQGYPAPYAPYPMMVNPNVAPNQVPVSPYPTYTISDDQTTTPQPNHANQALLNETN